MSKDVNYYTKQIQERQRAIKDCEKELVTLKQQSEASHSKYQTNLAELNEIIRDSLKELIVFKH